ncbi:MAG: class I SAM-dependent methyltransferase [Planctomycetaceae bacterium]
MITALQQGVTGDHQQLCHGGEGLSFVKQVLRAVVPVMDLCIAPFVLIAAFLMRVLRRAGVERFPISRRCLSAAGVFPIVDHYYEPLINFDLLIHPLEQVRNLPGVDLNIPGQLELLRQFRYSDELRAFAAPKRDDLTYSFGNGYFDSGDAEFLYNMVRIRKPRRVVEIGSGNSTLLVIEAVKRNRQEDPSYVCEHVCIEPYEMPWLERSGVHVRRERVELVSKAIFEQLDRNDLLFIDSSHVIRPQGDVLCEFLEILPVLRSGVFVHIHDIFTPRDYPRSWVVDKVRLWDEQYLLEAMLSRNPNWRIIGAVNYLKHDHYEALKAACPFLTPEREPGSFYIERV